MRACDFVHAPVCFFAKFGSRAVKMERGFATLKMVGDSAEVRKKKGQE